MELSLVFFVVELGTTFQVISPDRQVPDFMLGTGRKAKFQLASPPSVKEAKLLQEGSKDMLLWEILIMTLKKTFEIPQKDHNPLPPWSHPN